MLLYIKSAVVGLATVLAAIILYVSVAGFVFQRRHPLPPGAEAFFDLRAFSTTPTFGVIVIAAFALGFYWEFRSGR